MIEGKKIFILGMARSGYEAAKLLIKHSNEVVINDFKIEQDPEHIKELEALGVKIVLGEHPDELFNDTFDYLVKNPGVPLNQKYIFKAKEWGIPVMTEVELASYFFPKGAKVIGITGTNGKTTTTTMIYELLKSYDDNTFLGGNIGLTVCYLAEQLDKNSKVVLEISDHQLASVDKFKTDISILTNISEAHIDFHGSYEAYKAAKKRIFDHHTSNDLAIINKGNEESMLLTSDIDSTKLYFSSSDEADCMIKDKSIYYMNEKIIDLKDIKVKGMHNYENVMCAIMVVKEFGVPNELIVDYFKDFRGVEHRIEYVDTINGVEFYNDSKSTNNKAIQIALSAFDSPTIVIMGGQKRVQDFLELEDYMKHVKKVICYGENKLDIKEAMDKMNIECIVLDNLTDATNRSFIESESGDTVLLSPATASWDQFKDYEVRGNLFKEIVKGNKK